MVAVLLAILLFAAPAQAVVYLCPVDGDGSDANPYRSRALSELLPGRGNVDLRSNVTQALGFMLCESDRPPTNMTGVVMIGAARAAAVGAGLRTAIGTALGKPVSGTTVEEVIKELVIPRLAASQGTYEIILGTSQPRIRVAGTFRNDIAYKGLAGALQERSDTILAGVLDALSTSVAWASRLAAETFNCGDAGALTCVHTWADKTGTAIDIVSNQASASGSATNAVYAAASAATVDHEVVATLVSATTGGTGTNVTCSILGRTTADATLTYYRTVGTLRNSGELNDVSLVRTVANSSTTLATDTTDFANGDRLGVRMVSTTITAWKNGVSILSASDSNITTGTYGGLRYFGDGASSNCTWDNYRINDVTTRPVWSN